MTIKYLDLLVLGLSEFSASVMYIGMGCLTSSVPYEMSTDSGFRFGMAALACTQCFGCISGAHINPCVTVAALILGKVKFCIAIVYVICQFLGAIFGYVIAFCLMPDSQNEGNDFCLTTPLREYSDMQALGIEFALTACWIFTMCSVWDSRNQSYQESFPIRLGFIILSLTTTGTFFTGASMNPARTLAPALFQNSYQRIWIYFVGPIVAAAGISISWKYLYAESDSESNAD